MNKKLSNKEWKNFIDDYCNNHYNSITINEFCKGHNLSKQQFHYHKKRITNTEANNSSNTVFQALTITSTEESISQTISNVEVKISIDNAVIAIPVSETTLISRIIKDLSIQC